MTPKPSADSPILPFESAEEWDAWLAENHASHSGIWMRISKVAARATSITYAEALEAAL